MARETGLTYKFASNPLVTSDSNSRYQVGDNWINTSTDEIFECFDVSVGAAVWSNKESINLNGPIIIGPDAILAPTTISGNQNNYSPTGFVIGGIVKKSFLILTPDANWNITGLEPPSPAISNRITIFNNSSFTLKLKNNDGLSTASYRFLSKGNIDLQSFEAMDYIYSSILLRYVAITK